VFEAATQVAFFFSDYGNDRTNIGGWALLRRFRLGLLFGPKKLRRSLPQSFRWKPCLSIL
jgi:hypothetical protein